MKTALRTIAIAGLLSLLAAGMFGQQPTLTRLVTIAGDSTTKLITRAAMDYLPSGVIWLAATDFVGTGKQYMYRSTDNGATWAKTTAYTNAGISGVGITGVAAKDANICNVITTSGEIFRTTNGGAKWDTACATYSQVYAFGDGIRFVSGDTMIAYGDNDEKGLFVARSFDAGKTWTRTPNVKSSLPNDSLNMDQLYESQASYAQGSEVFGRTIWLTLDNTYGDPPVLLKSTDAGATWAMSRMALPGGASVDNYLRSITFKDANVGFGVCRQVGGTADAYRNYLVKTTDGGRTWSDTISIQPGFAHVDARPMTVRAIRGTNTVIAVGYGGPAATSTAKAWISNDNGVTWISLNAPSPVVGADLRNVVFGTATQGIIAGYQDLVKITFPAAASDSVNVTFWANTAAVPDTLKPTSFVQIRGAANVFGPWSSASKAILSNVAGDYWKGTVKLKTGDTIQYKFFTFASSPLVGDPGGWEQNSTDGSSNRIIAVGKSDTTLPLQYVNGTPDAQPQFFKPYVDQKDSIEIWFRVNMSSLESFNKATQFVGVRGGTAPLDWGKSILLKQESQHGNGGSRQYDGTNFWSGYARFPKSAFANDIEHKFVVLGSNSPTADVVNWESSSNRLILKSPGISDTTLYWRWWSDMPFVPFQGKDTVVVTFRANMARAVAERGFSFGDTVQVRTGYGGTAMAVRIKALTRSGLTGTLFTATDTIVSAVGKAVNYQYYMVKYGNEIKEDFYDFNDAAGSTQAERRKLTLTSKSMSVFDTVSATSDMRRMPRFRNTSKLSKNVLVTYTVDIRPAYYTVKAGKKLVATNVTPYVIGNVDSLMKWGVWMNGPAVGGWDVRGGWGAARRADTTSKMYDDGTHGDVVKGDSVYSLAVPYTTADFVGQEFKFGIGCFDNEGGFGNNHIENIDDATSTAAIVCQFGSIDPKFFNSWDFDLKKPKLATAVEATPVIPLAYDLSQNYPNPFNPSTEIRFALPTEETVTLKVFNVLGQEILTLVEGKLGAGNHAVRFDASKLTSGVYLYQITAGKFSETKKMVLMK